jgi:discoidin domain receptor family protein 2
MFISGGLVSYSMPQGDKRGATYEFYDYSYDGEWRGDSLVNGLGSLTDGDLGPADYKLSYYSKSKSVLLSIN